MFSCVVLLRRSVSIRMVNAIPQSRINYIFFFSFKYGTKLKLTSVFNEDVRQMLLREEIKPKKHPGKCNIPAEPLPANVIDSIVKCLKGNQKNCFLH